MGKVEEARRTALKWALKNALDYGGKAQPGPVISKVFAEIPDARGFVGEVVGVVREVVEWVNTLDKGAQETALSELAPELLRPVKRREERGLPDLPGVAGGAVVLRLPPEPSGYMHLGHAFHGIVNYLYREKYGGSLWLRFEDTNPRKVRAEYYESYRDGYRWCGIRWDAEKNNSDDMELYYEYAERMISAGHLYVCMCSREEMSEQRAGGYACGHRSMDVSWQLEQWDRMLEGRYREGEAAVRFAGDPASSNTALRDPVLLRVVEHPHPLRGDRYLVWPTYDFAVAIQDANCGVTHVLRTAEFMFRDALQDMIRERLGLKSPIYVEYSRFEFEGTPLSRRRIRELIEKGVVAGWDDPRLGTVAAVRRRGFSPEALHLFVKSYVALTPSRKEYSWDLLHAINRRVMDPDTPRLFFTPNPWQVEVRGLGGRVIQAPLHPSTPLGSRTIEVGERLYIAGDDAAALRPGDRIRLKYLSNIRVVSVGSETLVTEAEEGGPEPGLKVIQWVPEGSKGVSIVIPQPLFRGEELVEDSLKVVKGLVEPYEASLPLGGKVQFERFGYCVKDSEDSYVFTHP
jgi:glutamyl-tRNA synthetase